MRHIPSSARADVLLACARRFLSFVLMTRCCGVNTSEGVETEAVGENRHTTMKGGGGRTHSN